MWDRRTAVKLTRIDILAVGVLQLFADATDGNTLSTVDEQLRVASSIAAIGVELLPLPTGSVVVLQHVVLLVPLTVGLLGIRPVDHLHMVGIEVIEEHGLGCGVAHLGNKTVKTVDSEGVAIGSARCLTFIRATGRESQRTNDEK